MHNQLNWKVCSNVPPQSVSIAVVEILVVTILGFPEVMKKLTT